MPYRGPMLRITFDASSWKIAASPQGFPKAADIASFRKIHAAAAEGKLLATLPETVFALESVKDAWRQRMSGDRGINRGTEVSEQPDGTLRAMRDTEARAPANPAGNPQLTRHWKRRRERAIQIAALPAARDCGQLGSPRRLVHRGELRHRQALRRVQPRHRIGRLRNASSRGPGSEEPQGRATVA